MILCFRFIFARDVYDTLQKIIFYYINSIRKTNDINLRHLLINDTKYLYLTSIIVIDVVINLPLSILIYVKHVKIN